MNRSSSTEDGGTGRKILIGCAIGCGVFVVLAIIGFSSLAWWAVKPGEQIATATIVGEDSIGSFEVDRLADDPGISELIVSLLRVIRERDREQMKETLPDSMRWLTNFGNDPEREARDLKKWFPRDATLILESGDPGQPQAVVAAVNLASYPRLVRFLLGRLRGVDDEEISTVIHRGVPIDRLGADPAIFVAFSKSTILVSHRDDALVKVIDRIADGTTAAEPNREVERLIVERPSGWDLRGGLANEEEALYAFFDFLDGLSESEGDESAESDESAGGEVEREATAAPIGADWQTLPLDDVLTLWFGVDLITGDQAEVVLRFECRDGPAAQRWQAIVDERIVRLKERAGEEGVRLSDSTVITGRTVTATLAFDGTAAWFNRRLLEWYPGANQATMQVGPVDERIEDNRQDVDSEEGSLAEADSRLEN